MTKLEMDCASWSVTSARSRGIHIRGLLQYEGWTVPLVAQIFELTEDGVIEIRDGSDWKPEHRARR